MTERPDMRAFCFEIEEPAPKPRVRNPNHPGWEKLLPAPWLRARRRRRTAAAFEEWRRRVDEWEAAGRVQRTRVYIPAAEVDIVELPDGTREVSVTAFPADTRILSTFYPS